MATISESLVLNLVLDSTGYSKGLRKTEKDSKKFADKVGKSAKKASKSFDTAFTRMRKKGQKTFSKLTRGARGFARGLGTVQVALAGIGIGLAVKELSAAASRFEEIEGKFKAVFKEGAIEQRKLIEDFGTRVGRSTTELLEFQATLQDTFVPLGIARDKAAEFADQVTKLGIDIASFNNKQDKDVIRDLQSALVGNTETVRKYGIVINQARVKQELLNMGIVGGIKAATEGEKALARLNLIVAGSSDAIGDAIRTASSFENQMKKLKATVLDASIIFGKELNKTILQTIEEMGGLDVVLALVKLAFKAVAEAGKVFVRVLGSYVGALGETEGASRSLELSLIGLEQFFRQIEIVLRIFIGTIGFVASGLHLAVEAVILLGKALFFVGSTVLLTFKAAFAGIASFLVDQFQTILGVLQIVADAVGADFIAKPLSQSVLALGQLSRGFKKMSSEALPSIDDVKDGFVGLVQSALDAGARVSAAFDVTTASQFIGAADAGSAINALDAKRARLIRQQRKIDDRSSNNVSTIGPPRVTLLDDPSRTADEDLIRIDPVLPTRNRNVGGFPAPAPSTVSTTTQSVEVNIENVTISTAEAVKDPDEAARILGDTLQTHIRTGQREAFAPGPR